MNNIQKVYNGKNTIIDAGFTMKSNYILPMLTRMVDEKIITRASKDVIQIILQYKHTEKAPFPSYDQIAEMLNKSNVWVKKAVQAIKKAGVLFVTNPKKVNTYDFSPLFELLEKFIVEFVHNENKSVKVLDLMKKKFVQPKKENDFSWTEEYKEDQQDQEDVQEEKPEPEVVLPTKIRKLIEVNGVSEEGIEAIKKSYASYSGELDDKIFMDKISVSSSKKNFVAYYKKCIDSAYVNGEQPTEEPEQQPAPKKQTESTEVIPTWFGNENGKTERSIKEQIEITKNYLNTAQRIYNLKPTDEALKNLEGRKKELKELQEKAEREGVS
ncbi:hypothetical protein [Halobacillus karajensis]|uniref:hypothetical protein n=1 Tax=Halobacillus karajensis TaxID=195088 RepID=UPI00045D49C5|nr:hypothetical protein [Halobacillus karajensis]CDQ21695.1 hypothetical protein BN982_04104 [Halobacillus karajensis]